MTLNHESRKVFNVPLYADTEIHFSFIPTSTLLDVFSHYTNLQFQCKGSFYPVISKPSSSLSFVSGSFWIGDDDGEIHESTIVTTKKIRKNHSKRNNKPCTVSDGLNAGDIKTFVKHGGLHRQIFTKLPDDLKKYDKIFSVQWLPSEYFADPDELLTIRQNHDDVKDSLRTMPLVKNVNIEHPAPAHITVATSFSSKR
jgi:hypothetical protein